jgi:hypothetical protein
MLSSLLQLVALSVFAQEPKIFAPHRAVAPRLAQPKTWKQPVTPRLLRGGLWMTGPDMRSSIRVTNNVKTSTVAVTPVVYVSNGARLTLDRVVLEPAGTAVISINDALASIASHRMPH